MLWVERERNSRGDDVGDGGGCKVGVLKGLLRCDALGRVELEEAFEEVDG